MSVILVDTKYFGQYFRKARRELGIKSSDCARMFGLTQRQILRIECGKLLIPDRVLEKNYRQWHGHDFMQTAQIKFPQSGDFLVVSC